MIQDSTPPAIALVTRKDANTAQIWKIETNIENWLANRRYIAFRITDNGIHLTAFHNEVFWMEVCLPGVQKVLLEP
jgi:hypothetical protein